MPITISPIAATAKLSITGDIERVIEIPLDGLDDLAREVIRYSVALSDGTMLVGSFLDDETHRLDVAVEGAGIVRGQADGGVRVEWPVEWLTVASDRRSLVRADAPEPLPLFPQLAA